MQPIRIFTQIDFYPFGMLMPERSYSSGGYRYGFNSQEKDDEVAGSGNVNTAEYWEYDCRFGRRWNLDPVPQIGLSDYVCFKNNPTFNEDPFGDKIKTERGTDEKGNKISRSDYRRMLISISLLRIYSNSYRKMYRDMRNSKDVFMFKAVDRGNTGAHVTEKPWETENGNTIININIAEKGNLFNSVAHETGHAWRMLQKLDLRLELLESPAYPKVDLLETSEERKRKWSEYNRKEDYVQGENIKRTAANREQAEIGAMHIENIVISELKVTSVFSKLKLTSSYPLGIKATRILTTNGNVSYRAEVSSYPNKVPLSFYDKKIDIYEEHNVKPIKK